MNSELKTQNYSAISSGNNCDSLGGNQPIKVEKYLPIDGGCSRNPLAVQLTDRRAENVEKRDDAPTKEKLIQRLLVRQILLTQIPDFSKAGFDPLTLVMRYLNEKMPRGKKASVNRVTLDNYLNNFSKVDIEKNKDIIKQYGEKENELKVISQTITDLRNKLKDESLSEIQSKAIKKNLSQLAKELKARKADLTKEAQKEHYLNAFAISEMDEKLNALGEKVKKLMVDKLAEKKISTPIKKDGSDFESSVKNVLTQYFRKSDYSVIQGVTLNICNKFAKGEFDFIIGHDTSDGFLIKCLVECKASAGLLDDLKKISKTISNCGREKSFGINGHRNSSGIKTAIFAEDFQVLYVVGSNKTPQDILFYEILQKVRSMFINYAVGEISKSEDISGLIASYFKYGRLYQAADKIGFRLQEAFDFQIDELSNVLTKDGQPMFNFSSLDDLQRLLSSD